jgi:hypothetical protein
VSNILSKLHLADRTQAAIFAHAGHGVFRDRPKEALTVIREFVLAECADGRSFDSYSDLAPV